MLIYNASFILGYMITCVSMFVDIVNVKTAKGLALQDILTEVHSYVHRSKCSAFLGYKIFGRTLTRECSF